MFAVNGILFNHESPRRGETFVTRKITRAAARIKAGIQEKLYLGNLNAKRDWGYAPEYCEAIWLMLQQDRPDDYVIATGENHTVRELAELAFGELGIQIDWENANQEEIGRVVNITDNYSKTRVQEGDVIIEVDPNYFRPTEVDVLIGDPRKRKKNWAGNLRPPLKNSSGSWHAPTGIRLRNSPQITQIITEHILMNNTEEIIP